MAREKVLSLANRHIVQFILEGGCKLNYLTTEQVEKGSSQAPFS